MGRGYFTAEQTAALGTAARRTTLQIILNDGDRLFFSTAPTVIDGNTYLEKLAPVDALNLELTAATEGIGLKISNVSLSLGRNLINTPDILSGTTAILGTYFTDAATGQSWHDEKIVGELELGDIGDDFVSVFFASKADAAIYGGTAVAALFPDSAVPAASLPPAPVSPPSFNDINNPPSNGGRGQSPFDDDFQSGGRYNLPVFTI